MAMGSLARQDEYYDPMSGLPTGGVMPEQPQQAPPDPRFAMGALAHPVRFEPGVGMWPAYKPPKELPDVGEPMVPSGPTWQGNQTANRAADVMGQLAIQSVVPQDPLDAGLMLATGPGRVGYKLAAGALGAIMNPDEAEAGSLNKLIKGIRAYHSSPHDFDKFDLAKIGTGEGAQVYGHGLYFAENPAVSGQGGQYWKAFTEHPQFKQNDAETLATIALRNSGADRAKALEYLHKDRDGYWQANFPRQFEGAVEMLKGKAPVGPRTYEVNIKADPAHMLDWDRGLHTQSPEVRAALERFGFKADKNLMRSHDDALLAALEGNPNISIPKPLPDPSGAQIYESQKLVPGGYRDKVKASERLYEAGIPGIKYLDQGSRGAGTGSSNYVVFDPSIIDIMKKYGIAGAAPAGMGALAAQDYYRNP
jgi:hypothetical protein